MKISRVSKQAIVVTCVVAVSGFGFQPGAARAEETVTITVTNTNDSGPGSLRDAISTANGEEANVIINFASEVRGTINLTSGELNIDKPLGKLNIMGPRRRKLVLNGNDNSRIFKVSSASDTNIVDLGIQGGKSNDSGGAVLNQGKLRMRRSRIRRNRVITGSSGLTESSSAQRLGGRGVLEATFGGGIVNDATLILEHCTISDNAATDGAGISNFGTLTISNSTISGNTGSEGGAIANANGATLTINSSTISDNTATTAGGGVYIVGGTVSLSNSIVAGNSAPTDPNISGTFTNGGFNLVNGDPRLGPLQDNGGTTETHALLLGSPAINVGDAINAPATDQRDCGRKGQPDIGSFEFDGVPPVTLRADLLIKKNSEAPAAFALNDVYQLTPHGAQIERQSVIVGGKAIYQVRVQNDTTTARPFSVKAAESVGDNWTIVYKQGGTDITTAIKSGAGHKTISLAPSAVTVITIEMTPNTGASATKSTTVRIFMGSVDRVTRDVVRATTTVAVSGAPA